MHSRPSWFIGCLLPIGLMTHFMAHAAPSSAVHARNAWIRWLPADIPAGAYMTLINTETTERVLIAVTSPDYGEVSIHQTSADHGISKMRQVDSVSLKPHIPFQFSEGGYHLMLMQPRRPVRPGDTVVMTLCFKQAPPVDVLFHVRAGG